MPTMRALDKNDPIIVAWEAHKLTEEYANNKKWAAHPEHVDDSLWALFLEGWQAARTTQQQPVVDVLTITEREELDLYRKALPAVSDTFRMIGSLWGMVKDAPLDKIQKTSASAHQRCAHAMNHIADVLGQVEAINAIPAQETEDEAVARVLATGIDGVTGLQVRKVVKAILGERRKHERRIRPSLQTNAGNRREKERRK